MLSQGKELAAIDFSQVIGGPLEAVITAQSRSAALTANYIQETAFEPSQGGGGQSLEPQKLKVVEFNFGQLIGSGIGGASQDAMAIKVPLLTMLPIPFVRVDSMTIDLNVNLHDTTTKRFTNTNTDSVSGSGEYLGTTFHTSITDQNTYQHSQIIDDTYSLRVTVHAMDDRMPGGMRNVLDMFSNVIQQQSALIQKLMSTAIEHQMKTLSPQDSGGASGGDAGGTTH